MTTNFLPGRSKECYILHITVPKVQVAPFHKMFPKRHKGFSLYSNELAIFSVGKYFL